MADDPRFSRPLYTVAQAARYVGMPPSTLATWAKGYTRHFEGRSSVTQGPVITAIPQPIAGAPTVPFIGLAEAMVVQAFRQTGLPLQRIRRALQVLSHQGELDHALASERLFSDGAQILYDYASGADDPMLRLLTVVDSGQRVFHEVIQDYLRRITFGDTWATELVLPVTGDADLLRVDPDVAAGDPLFVHGGAPLTAVVSRRKAGESVESIAADYDVPSADIQEALRAVFPQAA